MTDRTSPSANALSAHDHGNCELCDQIERELAEKIRNEQEYERIIGPRSYQEVADALSVASHERKPDEPVMWRREWEGDVSDEGMWVYAATAEERDEPLDRWQPLYEAPQPAPPSMTKEEAEASNREFIERLREAALSATPTERINEAPQTPVTARSGEGERVQPPRMGEPLSEVPVATPAVASPSTPAFTDPAFVRESVWLLREWRKGMLLNGEHIKRIDRLLEAVDRSATSATAFKGVDMASGPDRTVLHDGKGGNPCIKREGCNKPEHCFAEQRCCALEAADRGAEKG